MREYVLKIVGAAIIGTFSEYLVPGDWKKYIKLISGLLMLTVLLLPFGMNPERVFFESPSIEEYKKEGEQYLLDEVKSQLEASVELDAKNRVRDEFSKDVEVEVSLVTNSEGKIEKIEKIELIGEKDEAITERLKFVYGTDAVIWIKE